MDTPYTVVIPVMDIACSLLLMLSSSIRSRVGDSSVVKRLHRYKRPPVFPTLTNKTALSHLVKAVATVGTPLIFKIFPDGREECLWSKDLELSPFRKETFNMF